MTLDEFMYDHDVYMIHDLIKRHFIWEGIIDEDGNPINQEPSQGKVETVNPREFFI